MNCGVILIFTPSGWRDWDVCPEEVFKSWYQHSSHYHGHISNEGMCIKIIIISITMIVILAILYYSAYLNKYFIIIVVINTSAVKLVF